MEDIQQTITETAEAYKGRTTTELKIMLCEFALKVIGITTEKLTEGINTPNAH